MSKHKRWLIDDDMYIEDTGCNVLKISCLSLGDEVSFMVEDIDGLIDALKQAKSYFKAQDLAEQEKQKLAIWGKAKTPAPDEWETSY